MRLLRLLPDLPPLLVRGCVLTLLSLIPILLYVGIGAYLSWVERRFLWVWWSAPVCWGAAWMLSRIWRKPTIRMKAATFPDKPHWTPRDRAAANIVREHQQRIDELDPEQLTDPHFYVSTAQAIAVELARHYHPRSTDPISSLTVPEVLAAVRLVADDLERWFLDSVPGSRLITIRQWRTLSRAPKWWNRIQNIGWAASMLASPTNVLRYLSSQLTLGPVAKDLQAELLAAVYLQFVRQAGYYLIEMNSGRLRGGTDLYRQHLGRETPPAAEKGPGRAETPEAPPAEAGGSAGPAPVTVLLLGQAKSGKSSLVNALLGERRSDVDVLPATGEIARYHLDGSPFQESLVLLDSPGYAESGLTEHQRRSLQETSREADAILLVMAAHHPAREADRKALDELKRWYEAQPQLKPPPVIAVLTHVDRLSPAMEWRPPYDWHRPRTKKEQSIRGAVDYTRELFGTSVECVVPVRADEGQEYGIEEQLVPAIAAALGEARAAGLLRTLHQKLDADRFKTLKRQTLSAGKELFNWWSESRRRS